MADGRSDDSIRDDPATDADAAGADEEAGEAGELDEVESAGSATSGPGALLRAAREAGGLDRDELARTLNLSQRVIRALEEDDDEQLPGATFVRGYIRSWARLTGEPVEPLLAAYEARAGRPRPVVQPTPGLEPGSAGPGLLHHRPGLVMTVVTLILVVAGAMVLFGIWPDALEPSAPGASSGTSGAVAEDRAASQRPVTSLRPEPRSSAQAAADAEGAAAGPTAVEAGSSSAEPSAAELPGAARDPEMPSAERPASETPVTEEPMAADVVTEVSADGSATRVLAGGEAHLHAAFSGDCWVEVRDRDDRVVHRDLHRSGQVLDLLGRAPFRVRLGYAPVVELRYNDSRVPLAPHTRNDVAALVIGR